MNAVLVGIFAVWLAALTAMPVHAVSSVVISQLQTADSLAATNEAVEIYNNSLTNQDITDWCLRYSSSASLTTTSGPKYCFTAPDAQTRLYLSAGGFATVATLNYAMPSQIAPDGRFSSSGMAASGGHVWLELDVDIIDVLGWGSAQFGEGYVPVTNLAPTAPNNLQALHRKVISGGIMQDTDDNRADFEIKVPSMRSGGIYEKRIPVDICTNLADIQEVLPDGYGFDDSGNCELLNADKCANIGNIQVFVPSDMIATSDNECYEDACNDIEGLQLDVPAGYRAEDGGCIALEARSIVISEVLPSVSGSDEGREFIELYNPNLVAVSLDGYVLSIGKNYEKTIVLEDITVSAMGYTVLYDAEFGFTLLNTLSNLRLTAPAGNVVSVVSYMHPNDDQAWAEFEGTWQYTNQPTPGAKNVPFYIVPDEIDTPSPVAPCATGKYRHPITNRCRNIQADTTMLVACDNDEYRNPDTGRCRKIATLATTLVPCSEGSERNPETNRCRKVAGASDTLSPCQEGYERNPATNRCRKSLASSTIASKNPIHMSQTGASMLESTLIATVGLSAVGYGLFEWRSEFFRGVRRITQALTSK